MRAWIVVDGEDVEVEGEVTPGEPVKLTGHPDTWHDSSPDEVRVLGAWRDGVPVELDPEAEDAAEEALRLAWYEAPDDAYDPPDPFED